MDQDLPGVNTAGGPWNIVLDGGPDPPQRVGSRLGIILPIMDLLHILGTGEARDLKFCMHIEGWGP